MTSSLVGSEMCIRDSFNPMLDQVFSDDIVDSATKAEGTPPLAVARSCSCLLYTSDAADDM
eukprot:348070-Prorocentrum_lima.AAC.1